MEEDILLECYNLDNCVRFYKTFTRAGAIKFLKKCCYSPTIGVLSYQSRTINSDLEYWFGRQVQDILPVLQIVRNFPLYNITLSEKGV